MLRSTRPAVGDVSGRRGTIIALMALTLVALVGFLGLAIDLGMLAIAKNQAQQAADLAALTAARTLNGVGPSYNQSAATTNGQNILTYNSILGQSIQPSSQLTLTYGSYDYNQTSQVFNANYPGTSGVPLSAVTATVTTTRLPSMFSTVFGNQLLPNVTATAQAVHRPRDVALVVDLSGSMRMGTCLGYDFYTSSRTTNNPDTVVPSFGQYSSGNAGLIGSSSNRTSGYDNYTLSPSNTTASNSSYALTYINSFYQSAAYASTLVRAFDSYSSGDSGSSWAPPSSQTPIIPPSSYATTPGGDVPLFASGSTSTYATNVSDVLGSSTTNILWELDGYSAYSAGQPDTSGTGSVPTVWTKEDYSSTPFNGYTQGPGYYGKTFFMWPPDPRTTNAMSNSTLTNYLNALGITNGTDQNTLSSVWSTWQGQGSAGLTNLKTWLTGGLVSGVTSASTNYMAVPVPGITSWNGVALTASNQPLTYYAVCRLFNRSYPGGAAWTSTAFSADWRQQFFGTTDNRTLFNGSGKLRTPNSGGYTINYNAILTWLTNTANPFPTQMRSGRVKYYGSIPSSITGSWSSYGGTDQRFWVEFIDHVLGFRQTASGTYQDVSAMAGYGSDFTWGTASRAAPPSAPYTQGIYMNYTDNPQRGNLRYWFSPILMVDYLHNYNMSQGVSGYFVMQPGNSYEAPLYTAKEAYMAAISTMQNNHPNDWFTLVPYSWPRPSANSSFGRLNGVSCPLGTNYTYAKAALLFPFSTINADGSSNNTEVTPYDADPATSKVPSANFVDTPRGDGDTCFAMGLMLSYNQFAVTQSSDSTLRTYVTSSPITFPTGMAGGMGRRGAQKVVIFETDGLANCSATASLTSGGSYNYYKVRYDMNRPYSSEYPTINASYINDPTVLSQVYSLVQQLSSDYGTTRNPFKLYALGFGPVFQGSDASAALSTLQTMQYYGGTQSSASTALPSSQIITGTDAQMSANMITAFTTILQSGVQIALIK